MRRENKTRLRRRKEKCEVVKEGKVERIERNIREMGERERERKKKD